GGLGLATAAAHAAQVPTTWCGGTSPSQTDRKPNLLAGNQIDVIYAHASDSPDRFAQFASPIASDVASIDAWWRKQDPTRTPRFDLFPFAGCAATFGKLDLADDTLPQASTSYFSLAPRANRIIGDLVGRPFSAGDSTRKYLIYYDGAVSDVDVCGEGGGLADLYSSGPSWSIVFVQSCGLNVGDGNDAANVAAHELLHSLGAVPAGAPHEC